MSVRIHENQFKKDLYRHNDTVSKNLRFLRLLNGYTQQQMADVISVSRSSYHAIERGARLLDFETITILADFYDMDLSYLVSFDICDQILNMIRVEQDRIKASVFLERYFALSRNGKEQIKEEIFNMYEFEEAFRKFPWKYEGFDDLFSPIALFKKRLMYEKEKKENKL